MDSLELVRTFREVAHHGSFSKAAETLGLSKANVSKYVAALEAQFNVRLLNRTTRSVSLTDAGILLLERSEPLIELMDSARDELHTRALQPSGRIRISTVAYLGDSEFVDLLTQFRRMYPKVHLSLEFSNRPVDLVEEAVDLAIRVGRLRDSDLIVRKLRPVPFALVASPRYWRERGKPRHPNDLSLHETLIFTTGNTARSGRNLWIFQDRNGEDIEVPVRGMIDANDGRALRKFALNGTGIAYAPRLLVQSHLDTGDLETALDDFMPQDIWVMLAYAQRRHNSAALRTLVQYLEQNFRIPS